MRDIIRKQLPLVTPFIDHEHAQELAKMSEIIDSLGREVVVSIHKDLVRNLRNPDKGRTGMSAEQVLRSLVIKQMEGLSYAQLEFRLADSICYRSFCRFGITEKTPDVSTLKNNIKLVRGETMEMINRAILRYAKEQGIENGRKVRTDCTVEETNIHEPSDAWLLYDSVRVLARLMHQAQEMISNLMFTDHSRRAKRRFRNIQHCGVEEQRVKHYRDLVKITEKTVRYAASVVERLDKHGTTSASGNAACVSLAEQLRHYSELAIGIINQTTRRVFYKENVPAGEKVVSIFEPHSDIIIKDRRDTFFGHKLCLSTGRSGLVLDCVVLRGNPADSTLAVEMIERQKQIWGRAPLQASFDGGFASEDNLKDIKGLGVKDAVFNKKRGLDVSEMAKSTWVYRCLSRFRAGIEGGISFLKRCFGLARCLWKGFESFKAYTWASILSHNLLIVARHQLK
jgi:IS5 family transposase